MSPYSGLTIRMIIVHSVDNFILRGKSNLFPFWLFEQKNTLTKFNIPQPYGMFFGYVYQGFYQLRSILQKPNFIMWIFSVLLP